MVLCVVMMGVLILVLGLMLELNHLNFERFNAQSSSDLASKSALAALYKTTSGPLDQSSVNAAKQIGVDIFNRNAKRSDASIGHFEFGRFNLAGSTFGSISDPAQFRNINAVKHDFDLGYKPILGSLMVKSSIELNPESVAMAGRTHLMLCIDASRSMNYNAFPGSKFPPGASTIHERPRPGSRWYVLLDCLNNFFNSGNELLSSDSGSIGLATFGGGFTEGGGKRLLPPIDPYDPNEEPRYEKVRSPLDLDLARLDLVGGDFLHRRGEILNQLASFIDFEALGYGTSLFDGINAAIDGLNATSTPGNRVIILMADGAQSPDLGRPDPIHAANRAASEGISILAIGYAVGNSPELQQIAQATNGKFFAASTPDELTQAFDQITELLKVRLVK
ncbi:MAG: VWA domain-containing protein [Pirellulaceae bacterium]